MKITVEVTKHSHRHISLMRFLTGDNYQFSIEAENQALHLHGVMQAEGSANSEGAAVGQRSVGTNAEAVAGSHGICKERNCKEPATKDYNGHEHWVCDYHYDKLNDEFDEEYR